MTSSKAFFVVLCLLCTALPALAQKPNGKPNDKGAVTNDDRSRSGSQQWQQEINEVGGKKMDQWRRDLHDVDPSVRAAAIMAVLQFGPSAPKLIPDVVEKLTDGDASPRAKAALILRMVPHFPADRLRILKRLGRAISNDPQTIIRYEAAVTLKYLCPLKGTDERAVIQDLLVSIKSPSTFELREACIDALIYAGPDPKNGPDQRVTRELITRATFPAEPTQQVRLKAIMALGAQGRPHNPKDYADVMAILRHRNNYRSSRPVVRIWAHAAIIALEEKADKKELDALAKYLEVKEAAVRAEAARALGELGEKAQAYVSNICDMLQHETDVGVKAYAAMALGGMGNTGVRVLSELIRMTEEQDKKSIPAVLNACLALGELGANTPEVIRALNKVLEHTNLEDYQKEQFVKKAIEHITHPKQKTVRQPDKAPQKDIRRR